MVHLNVQLRSPALMPLPLYPFPHALPLVPLPSYSSLYVPSLMPLPLCPFPHAPPLMSLPSCPSPYVSSLVPLPLCPFPHAPPLVPLLLLSSFPPTSRPWLDLSDDARVMGGLTGWLVLLLLELVFFLLFVLNYPVFFVSDDTYQVR